MNGPLPILASFAHLEAVWSGTFVREGWRQRRQTHFFVKDDERIQTPPDYDFPLESPTAKEVAAKLRPNHLVLNLTSVPEPVVEIFRDQLVPFKDAKNPALVCMISRGDKFRYYSIPFSMLVPLLGWVRLSEEKRPRWRLNLVPKKHALVARNGPRVETVNLQPYYNKPPA